MIEQNTLNSVIVPKFEVIDKWHRTEYQHRGSPHIHGLLWLKDAPDVSNLDNADEDQYFQTILWKYYFYQ